MSHTQYLESQEDQDIIRLLNFTRTQERRRDGFFCVSWNGGEGGLYSSGGENKNGRSFNESWQRIMNLDLILAFKEIGCIKFRNW